MITRLVDAVYADREWSQLSDIFDRLRETLEDADEISPAMILDIIAMRWLLTDVLLGQGFSLGRISTFEQNPWQEIEVRE
jgi:hypothetical protein